MEKIKNLTMEKHQKKKVSYEKRMAWIQTKVDDC